MDHWDPDGSKTFCSNGSRAALALPGAPDGPDVELICSGARVRLRREGDQVGIRMPEGEPCGWRPVPMATPFPAAFGWIGNPQLVMRVPSVGAVDLPRFAPPFRHDPAIPGGTNVNLVEVVAPGRARIRTWERGVEGETLCCGTGSAVSAAWLAREEGVRRWSLETAGGDEVRVELDLDAAGAWRDLWLSGPVRKLGIVQPDPTLLLGLQG